jgi:endonuclease-3
MFVPHHRWRELYDCIAQARKTLEAPVDTIGCDRLHDKAAPREDQRYQMLLALMLSAQTRDQMTAQAMRNLREYGCTPRSIRRAPLDVVTELIRGVCFHNNKAKHIKEATARLLKDFDGVVPSDIAALVSLPGVGPKMAHLFLQCADGKVEGIGVDVHVHRIAGRFQWVPSSVKTPEDTRKALESWLPRELWGGVNSMLVGWGQTVCLARNPKCGECPAASLCPSAFKECGRPVRPRTSSPSSDIEDIGDRAETRRTRRRTS